MRFFIQILLYTTLTCSVIADTVTFRDGKRLEAESVALTANGDFLIDGKKYAAKSIAQWRTGYAPVVGASHSIRLMDGQIFVGSPVKISSQALTWMAEPWGMSVDFDKSNIAAIHFLRRDKMASASSIPFHEGMGILHRSGASPVRCTLNAISPFNVSVSTQAGTFRLSNEMISRYDVQAYEFPTQMNSARWEIGLSDGSVVMGDIVASSDEIRIKVEKFPEIKLPVNALRYLRNRESVHWLPLWRSGKSVEDGLEIEPVVTWAQAISIPQGDSVALFKCAPGTLRLQASVSKGTSAKLILLDKEKEIHSIDLNPQMSSYTFELQKSTYLHVRIESGEADAVVQVYDLMTTGKGAK